ncbi:MAG TPA: hypothetical protein VFT76_00230 [Actinomycetota bacterium]|nr:hypothetical protein [Actinomycetota bacterium]
MAGIRIRHRTLRSCLTIVPLVSRPMTGASLYECPHCGVVHPFKTIHLWLDDSGSVIVSRGVFDAMRTEWSGPPEYDVVGEVAKPPPLAIGKNAPVREAQDQSARKITFHRKPVG